jgi:long-chain acyl-CoA synthetase
MSLPLVASRVNPELPARTAGHIWREQTARAGEGIAFRVRRNGQWNTLTWRQADQTARSLAAGLIDMGIEAGDRVAILCRTRLEWVLCDVALVLAGAVSVPIYPSNTAEQCAFIIKDSGARAVIAEDAVQLEKLVPLVDGNPSLRLIHVDGDVTFDKPDSNGRTDVRLADVLVQLAPTQARPISLAALQARGAARLNALSGELKHREANVSADDVFTIIYTSGTTGQPKGVVLSHRNMVASFESAIRAFDLRETDEQYLFLPLAHVLGREVEWAPILAGAPIAFSDGLARIKYDLVDVRPTFMAGVPRIFEKLYTAVQAGTKQGLAPQRAVVAWALAVGARHAAAVRRNEQPGALLLAQHALADRLVLSKIRRRLGLDRCRFLISGGAPLAPEIAEFFHAIGLLILEGYGLTETAAAAFVNRWNSYRFGTVGPAIDAIEYRLARDGEILLRGPSVFERYYNNPTATAEALDSDGWFRTGDIGAIEDGFLRIVDRKKDLIVTAGGKNVAPQMLENALKARCPLVSQVVVFGDKRSHCVALITPSEQAVRQFGGGNSARAAISPELRAGIQSAVDGLNARLASYETIKNFSVLPTDFSEGTGELTPSLKVKRDVVAGRHANVIDALYEKPPASL